MNGTAATAARWTAPFTAAQWQELEQQALIYKYLVAGVPVPPDLLMPIRRSFDTMAARFCQYPILGYGSYFGKKLDPEPGRCRRTDGKKWRCSKEAAPDSKYCERHMHRGRNRSRKPVETQPPPPQPQSQSPSASTVTSLAPAGGGSGGGFQNHHHHPLHSLAGGTNAAAPFAAGAGSSHLRMDAAAAAYGSGSKDLRYAYGLRANVDEYNLFSEASGSLRGVGMDTSLESSWRLMPSQISSFPLTTSRGGAALENNYTHFASLNDLGLTTVSSFQKPDCQQHSFFGNEFGAAESVVKQESQPLRPFFDEWPKTRDSWSDLADDNSNRACFSATQLSISIPMASSDFSTTSCRSPNDD